MSHPICGAALRFCGEQIPRSGERPLLADGWGMAGLKRRRHLQAGAATPRFGSWDRFPTGPSAVENRSHFAQARVVGSLDAWWGFSLTGFPVSDRLLPCTFSVTKLARPGCLGVCKGSVCPSSPSNGRLKNADRLTHEYPRRVQIGSVPEVSK